MLSPGFTISPKDLWNAIATQDSPQIVDVRRREAYAESPHLLPGAIWRDAAKAVEWAKELDSTRPIVVACKAGHEMSQSAAAQLRASNIEAGMLEGGYEAWSKAGLALVAKPELERIAPESQSGASS